MRMFAFGLGLACLCGAVALPVHAQVTSDYEKMDQDLYEYDPIHPRRPAYLGEYIDNTAMLEKRRVLYIAPMLEDIKSLDSYWQDKPLSQTSR